MFDVSERLVAAPALKHYTLMQVEANAPRNIDYKLGCACILLHIPSWNSPECIRVGVHCKSYKDVSLITVPFLEHNQYKRGSFIVCLTIVTQILITTFRLRPAGLY